MDGKTVVASSKRNRTPAKLMKTITHENGLFPFVCCPLARVLIIAGCLFALMPAARAVLLPPPGPSTNSGPVYTQLDSWSFGDQTGWTSDKHYAPVSFTNLAASDWATAIRSWWTQNPGLAAIQRGGK